MGALPSPLRGGRVTRSTTAIFAGQIGDFKHFVFAMLDIDSNNRPAS